MKSGALGQSTSQVEVTNVSPHGFWLFVGEEELFARAVSVVQEVPRFAESLVLSCRVRIAYNGLTSILIWQSNHSRTRSGIRS